MTLLSEWQRQKRRLEAQDMKVIHRVVNAYGNTYRRVHPHIETLAEFMQARQADGKLTKEAIKSSSAYRGLISNVRGELTDYQGYLKTEVKGAATDSARQGLTVGTFLLLAALADRFGVSIKTLQNEPNLIKNPPPDALSFLQDYLDPRGPLFGKIEFLAGYHSSAIADGILEKVGQGVNPKDIAKWITDQYGVGLTDAMRMTRTTQLYSYRNAAAATNSENSDLLQGTVWSAELDDVTCESCIALNGQVFEVDAICDDHHSGRCALLPWVKDTENPIQQSGQDWFDSQSEETQKSILGPGKYDAYQAGRFDFSSLTTIYHDEVFGDMRRPATLQELLGE